MRSWSFGLGLWGRRVAGVLVALALAAGCRSAGDHDTPAKGEQSSEERERYLAWLAKHDPDVYTLLTNQQRVAAPGNPEAPTPSLAPTTAPSVELPAIELPSYSPDIPPQLLFCDHKGFGRLTADAFEYYALDDLRRVAKIDAPGNPQPDRLDG